MAAMCAIVAIATQPVCAMPLVGSLPPALAPTARQGLAGGTAVPAGVLPNIDALVGCRAGSGAGWAIPAGAAVGVLAASCWATMALRRRHCCRCQGSRRVSSIAGGGSGWRSRGALRTRRRSRRQRVALRAAAAETSSDASPPPPGLGAAEGRWWRWREHRIRYVAQGSGPPVVLVHGFGASVDYFRKMFPVLVSEGYAVYALDLLGLGLSDKPAEETYSIAFWAELVQDFLTSVLPQPGSGTPAPVLVGNSIGSLISVTVAAGDWGQSGVRGLVLLNCAGGMNTKHMIEDDLSPPVLKFFASIIQGVLETLLGVRAFASWFFERVKTPENVRETLRGIYTNKERVDDELVSSILAPADNPNALDVFVKILTGEPGRSPDKLMPRVKCPVRLVWGDADNFTPLEGPYGQYFKELADERRDVTLRMVSAGHIPHDDNADEVHAQVMPWLAELTPKSQ